MQITKEMLEEKMQEVIAKREELLAQANACTGAIEDLEFWLAVLATEQPMPAAGQGHKSDPSAISATCPVVSPPASSHSLPFKIVGVEEA